jgi:hypothetical protein
MTTDLRKVTQGTERRWDLPFQGLSRQAGKQQPVQKTAERKPGFAWLTLG